MDLLTSSAHLNEEKYEPISLVVSAALLSLPLTFTNMASHYCVTSAELHVLECCGYPLKRTNAGCLVYSTRVFYMPVAVTCMVRKWSGYDLDKRVFN